MVEYQRLIKFRREGGDVFIQLMLWEQKDFPMECKGSF